ncbi:MAG: TonB family protein [Candidatus Adiutrix sp.]|nr:TonB family protein [Candidatus Adiutrix sp.]
MTALRFSLITERETPHLPREAGAFLLCLLTSAWLHLIFFAAWETLAGDGPGLFRIELPAPPAPLEIELTLETVAEGPAEPSTAGEAEEPAAPAGAEELSRDLEIARPAGAAQASPPVTAEPASPRFKSYNTAVRGAVAAKWLVPPEARINFHPGRLVVNCTIGRDGSLIRFVVDESTGSAILDHAGLEALRSAAPFPPFPPELAAFSQLDLTMIFDYQARYLGRGAAARP